MLRTVGWFHDATLILAVGAMLLVRKHSLVSVGVHAHDWLKATSLALPFMLVAFLARGLVPALWNDWTISPLGDNLSVFGFTLFRAFREDLIFVAFLQTRLYGWLKDDKQAVNIGAIIFGLMHAIGPLAQGSLTSLGAVAGVGLWVVACFYMHHVFVFLYKKHFSLISITLLHTVVNFSGRIWLEQDNDTFAWGFAAAVLGCVIVMEVLNWRDTRKQVDTIMEDQ